MSIIDISLTISADLVTYPGDPTVQIEKAKSIAAGAHANVSKACMGLHSGTHVDAPCHFIEGAAGAEQLPLEVLVGEALVVEVPAATVIDSACLAGLNLPGDVSRLLFKTRNSAFWAEDKPVFHQDFTGIDASGSRWLVEAGVKLVGLDYLSISPFGKSYDTHHILLESGVVIVEGLDLHGVKAGRYTLYCLPLKILGSDGAPARAILVK